MLLDPLQPGPLLVFWERKYMLKAVQPKILCWKFPFTSPNRPYLHCYSSPWKGFLLSRAFLFLDTCQPAPSQTTPTTTMDRGGEQICSGPSHWPISLRDHQLKGGRGICNRQEFQPSWALKWQWSPAEQWVWGLSPVLEGQVALSAMLHTHARVLC